MKRIYIYPNTARNKTGIRNPYMGHLRAALEKNFVIVNAGRPSDRGITDILRYLKSIDAVFLNWIEDLPGKHRGVAQTLFFLMMLRIFRKRKIRVIWILHNKKSHYRENQYWKNLLFNQMLLRSNLIITHAREGLRLIPDPDRAFYIPHPVRSIPFPADVQKELIYDIIIWGSITEYKGIDRFLGFLNEQGLLQKYRIMIAGKITTEALSRKIRGLTATAGNLTLRDEFVPEPELMGLIRQSRLVLITYQSDSVLSSGVLMDSLSQLVPIIGPHTGAFRDLAEMGLIDTFEDYPQLLRKIDAHLGPGIDRLTRKKDMEAFIEENSWDRFSEELRSLIDRTTA